MSLFVSVPIQCFVPILCETDIQPIIAVKSGCQLLDMFGNGRWLMTSTRKHRHSFVYCLARHDIFDPGSRICLPGNPASKLHPDRGQLGVSSSPSMSKPPSYPGLSPWGAMPTWWHCSKPWLSSARSKRSSVLWIKMGTAGQGWHADLQPQTLV